MPLDLSDTLVVGISATALFDLSDADALFRAALDDPDTAIASYRDHMLARENTPLEPGTGFPLVKALLNLNSSQTNGASPLVEIVVMSRNSPDSGLGILHSIRHHNLAITRSAFTGGESVVPYLRAFDVDLFLTTEASDAQAVIDGDGAAAVLSSPPSGAARHRHDQVRIAFDGDAVLFGDDSEIVFKTQGLERFHAHEDAAKDEPLNYGPYAAFLKKLARLQERLPGRMEWSPVRVALVTARNSPAEIRAIKTLRSWGVYADEAFFLGGVEKTQVLEAFQPHIFFDDQHVHLDKAKTVVPSALVPHRSDSPLRAVDGLRTVDDQ
ncbi:MAG: 5'-nucleotidase [Gammaproteobacteria bacterium]|nr:5'-nucleotidase [Gammaproteobacteria bacterium]